MEKDKIVFSSIEEKESYLKFMEKYFNDNLIDPAQDTGMMFMKMIYKGMDSDREREIDDGIGRVLRIIGFILIYLSSIPMSYPIHLIIGLFCLSEGLLKLTPSRGLVPTALALILSPVIIQVNLIRCLIQALKHKRKVKLVKKMPIIESMIEDEKNSKEKIADSLLEKVEKKSKDNEEYLSMKVIDKLEELKKEILKIENSELREEFITGLCTICEFSIRATKLSKGNRIEALNFVLNEGEKLNEKVSIIIKNERHKEREFEMQKARIH
jgi:hypothetical protein